VSRFYEGGRGAQKREIREEKKKEKKNGHFSEKEKKKSRSYLFFPIAFSLYSFSLSFSE
jgi:hypothetical protein